MTHEIYNIECAAQREKAVKIAIAFCYASSPRMEKPEQL